MNVRAWWVGVALVLGYGANQDPQTKLQNAIEFKDENGVVRMRIGDLGADLGFGLRLWDEKGRHAAVLRNVDSLAALQLASEKPESLIAMVSDTNGSRLAFGSGSVNHLVAGMNTEGVFSAVMRDGAQSPTLELKANGGENPDARLRVGNEKGVGLQVLVGIGGALIELVRDKVSALRLSVANDQGSFVEVGRKGRGIALQARVNGDMRIGLVREAVEFVLQAVRGRARDSS